MTRERLDVLFVSLFPCSPPTFGAQRRIEGLMRVLARRNRVTAVSLVSPEFDAAVARREMGRWCEEVVLVPARSDRSAGKRVVQLRALASRRSYEHHAFSSPALREALVRVLQGKPFDVVCLEAPFLLQHPVRLAPPGAAPPVVIVDQHNVEHQLARRSRDASSGLRRLHHAVNWRKVRFDEVDAWRRADGVAFTSEDDQAQARALVPGVVSAVVPNGVDVDHFRRRPGAPADPLRAMFFGTLNYFPNQDGVRYLLADVWPRIAQAVPEARLDVVGPHPTPEVLARRGPRIDVTGPVDDVRVHLERAGVVVVPLRVGGGTRLKILEAMAMSRPVVSTTIGAEGIAATDGRDILIADDAASFARAVRRVMEDPALATRLGEGGRALVERRYSWVAIGADLERFVRALRGVEAAGVLPGAPAEAEAW
jgi:glycosyltransferase involved in cell wall biosynthesis